MGIAHLYEILRKKCPQVFQPVHISQFQYEKVAVDFSLYLFKYMTIFGEEGWLNAMITLISCLKRNRVHAVMVFDGVAPEEKQKERQERKEKKEKLEHKIDSLEQALTVFEISGDVNDLLKEFMAKRDTTSTKRRLLLKTCSTDKEEPKPNFTTDEARDAIDKIKKQNVKLSSDHFALAKRVFDLLGIPYIQAPGEGESLCSDLCRRGEVKAVLTEDSDVLAYGSPMLLTKLNTSDDTCVLLRFDDVIDGMGLTQDEFLDFCIMCSCDYNSNIPGIGPEKSLKLIQSHKSIDNFPESIDVKCLNHVRVREIFTSFLPFSEAVKYTSDPNWDEFNVIMVQNNVRVNLQKLKADFGSTFLDFEE